MTTEQQERAIDLLNEALEWLDDPDCGLYTEIYDFLNEQNSLTII